MIRIQRTGDKTSFYEWCKTDNTWIEKYVLIGDFNLEFNDIENIDLQTYNWWYITPCNDNPGQKNIYCYNCNYDGKCPFD